MSGNWEIRFGFLVPPLTGQLRGKLLHEDLEHFDQAVKAVLRLHIRGLISDSVRDGCFRKIIKQIERAALQHEDVK